MVSEFLETETLKRGGLSMGLTLSRRKGEVIVIGGAIKIRVVDIRGDRVRLDIDAPRDIRIDREEVHEDREREKMGLSQS